jgi:hypothetical protein
MTPKMKRTLVFKQLTPTLKKFTIDRQARHKEEMVVTGMVKEAKRKLEDNGGKYLKSNIFMQKEPRFG